VNSQNEIPADWEVKRLKDVCDTFKSGFGITSNKINDHDAFPVYGGNGLRGYTNSFTHEGSFLLIGRQGALCGNILRINGKSYVSEHAIAVQTNKKNDIDFLAYYLDFKNLNRLSESSAQPGLSVEKLVKLKLPLPSLQEQRAIAACLSTWDAAITQTQQLIAQKELRKKWLMQQLLTGKKRLKGFKGEWKEVRLDECFEFIKSYSISRDGLKNDSNNSIYCIHYGDIHAFYENEFLDFSTQKNIPQIVSGKEIINERDYLKDGDIIMADASEDYEGVGEVVEVVNLKNKIAVGGLHTIVLRDIRKATADNFRAYLFASEFVRNELRKKATGTSVYSVTKSTLQTLVFKLPSFEEQIAIARVLQAADNELELLYNKVAKLKEQKRGLMQALLTGKKRLKLDK
jgi:type I restriction enzyme, S subunit